MIFVLVVIHIYWYQSPIIATLSDCRHLKVNLKKKISICWLDYSKVLKKKKNLIFWFATGAPSAAISANFWKKYEMALIGYSEAWGKLIHEKTLNYKISWHRRQSYESLLSVIFSLFSCTNLLDREYRIAWFREDLAFSPSCDLAPPPTQPFNPIIQYSLPLDKHSMNPAVVEASYMPY
jgi:hypothetical protein